MRRLLLVRHAIAEEPDGLPDRERRLTEEGRRKMRRAAQGLAQVVERIDLLGTSPLPRAHETADILAARFSCPVETVNALAPGGEPSSLLAWLAVRSEDCIALVGHQPDLGGLIALLTTGGGRATVSLRKGGAVLLEFPAGIGEAQATLRFALPPSVLRALG